MIRFRSLWTIQARHAFFDASAAEVLEFIVPPATQRALAGARAIARERDGALHVLIELDEAQQPLAQIVGRSFVFGLRPRDPAFETFTQPLGFARGETALWANAAAPNVLDAPRAVQLSGSQLRIAPRSAARPLPIRLLDPGNVERANGSLREGAEALSLPGSWPPGEWRIEEAGVPAGSLWIEPDLAAARARGLLVLTVATDHVAIGHTFQIDFAVRSDTLRYYVVANAFSQNEFDQVSVFDGGFTTEGRPQIVFDRLLPAASSSLASARGTVRPLEMRRLPLPLPFPSPFPFRAGFDCPPPDPAGSRGTRLLPPSPPSLPGAGASPARFRM